MFLCQPFGENKCQPSAFLQNYRWVKNWKHRYVAKNRWRWSNIPRSATSGYHRNGVIKSRQWCDLNCHNVSTIPSISISISISHPGNCAILHDIRENLYIHLIIYVVTCAQNIHSNLKKKIKKKSFVLLIIFPLFVLPNKRWMSNWCRKIAINRTITSKLIIMSITVNYEGGVSHRTVIYKLIPSGQGCRPVSCPSTDRHYWR